MKHLAMVVLATCAMQVFGEELPPYRTDVPDAVLDSQRIQQIQMRTSLQTDRANYDAQSIEVQIGRTRDALIQFRIKQDARVEIPKINEVENIPYRTEAGLDEYSTERCKLDLYLPDGKKDFPTVIWFHGGGLENGDKSSAKKLGRVLAADGIALASVNYRLSPKVKFPLYIEDAAAGAAWVLKQIAAHRGDRSRVFVSGHSAGGYLTLMLGMDERYLGKHSVKTTDFAGYIPVSGQTVTHFTIRKERGIDRNTTVVDEAAPLYFVRKDIPPMLILTADNEMASRVEENQLLLANLKAAGNKKTKMKIIPYRDHNSVSTKMPEKDDPARAAMLEFIRSFER